MLSWSAQETNTLVDPRAVTDTSIDPLLPGGRLLLAFVDAALARSPEEVAGELAARLGSRAVVTTATVIGNFQMMNRVADATGMPVSKDARQRNAELIDQLGLGRFDHSEEM